MAAHAKLSPSSAPRWLKCPGSPRLCAKVPRRATSSYAQEGTAAHSLGEKCLRKYTNPFSMKGEKIINDDLSEFIVDADMAEAVKVYIDFASKQAPLAEISAGHISRGIESKVEVCDEVWGTADLLVYNIKEKKLSISDYKHGRGVIVSPESEQIKCYGLGALLKLMARDVPVEVVVMYVVQPRAQSDELIRRHTMLPVHLLKWRDEVLLPGIEATKKKDAPLHAGDHCKFCDALPTCPQQAKEAMALAKVEFADPSPTFPDPEDLTPEQLVRTIELSDLLSTWAGTVKAYAQERAEIGTPLPGFKLVAKRSIRQWIDAEITAATLEMSLGEDAYNKKLLSPAQAEKALKAAGFDKNEITSLVHKPDTGLNLVPESDRRTAVVPAQLTEYMDTMDVFQ